MGHEPTRHVNYIVINKQDNTCYMHGSLPFTHTHTHTLTLCKWYLVPLTYLPTYLLTARCTVLLEQLTGLQLVKKFPAFHGTRRFVTALTSVRHLSLSWASTIQSIYPHPTSWRSILILSTHLRLFTYTNTNNCSVLNRFYITSLINCIRRDDGHSSIGRNM